MKTSKLIPEFIFESSWEVCNKVGGIYAVLSTRAKTLQDKFHDHVIFIGPDLKSSDGNPYFEEDRTLFSDWRVRVVKEGLRVRVGRWLVPGRPITVLVDFTPFFREKDQIYAKMWELYQVDSLHGYGDYDEASMFSYAAAKVVESYYHYYLDASFSLRDAPNVVYHGNEWMTGLGLLYINHYLPQVATIFTTHATSIGRSIAGNNKMLYKYFEGYNGDQMADELNMQSKHSIEKQTALNVDCFTTVSDITARECKQLMDKPVDVVLPNGFEDDFVPKGAEFTRKRNAARKKILGVANALLGDTLGDSTLIVSTSGRYEFRNKGIDLFIDAINRLRFDNRLQRNVVALIEVPAWVAGARGDLKERLASKKKYGEPLSWATITHWLHNMYEDRALGLMRSFGINNDKNDKVKLIFVPCYLDGDDGVFDASYYDMVLGSDLCVFPSYYEPWGYTPLESIAFKVPCITSDLAGFGLWAAKTTGATESIKSGVKVVHRDDDNYFEASEEIKDTIVEYAGMSAAEVRGARNKASLLSKKALWSKFIAHYDEAYDFALGKCKQRNK